MRAIFDFLFPNEKLTIYPEDMRTILGYQQRMSRGADSFTDSSAGQARPNQLVRSYRGQKEKFYFETPCN